MLQARLEPSLLISNISLVRSYHAICRKLSNKIFISFTVWKINTLKPFPLKWLNCCVHSHLPLRLHQTVHHSHRFFSTYTSKANPNSPASGVLDCLRCPFFAVDLSVFSLQRVVLILYLLVRHGPRLHCI